MFPKVSFFEAGMPAATYIYAVWQRQGESIKNSIYLSIKKSQPKKAE
jgi:hypothetical protein